MPRKTKKTKGSVLVIDDEKEILSSLRTVLESEGYTVYTADEGEKGMLCVKNLHPDIILLDVWLPRIDGLEILTRIKTQTPETPVVMISGHAGIETAVRATKMGATNFVEKPFNIEKILSVITSAIPQKEEPVAKSTSRKKKKKAVANEVELEEPAEKDATRIVRTNTLRKKRLHQYTIGKSVVLNGLGLISGKKIGMQLLPAPPDAGICFVDLASNAEVPLHPDNIVTKQEKKYTNSTVLSANNAVVRTVEHLLAVLHAYGITNLIVKVDEEIPNIDGSAIDFCNLLDEATLIEQKEKTHEIVIEEKTVFGTVQNDESYIVMTPFEGFEISLRIDFAKPIGVQRYTFTMESIEDFRKEIAPARTFNTLDNIDMAQKAGKAGSGTIGSHMIIHGEQVINTELRFKNEFVRHKILDIIGDLYLLGRPFRGRIKANRTSHAFNHEVVRALAKAYCI